jgi:hypothetical protein
VGDTERALDPLDHLLGEGQATKGGVDLGLAGGDEEGERDEAGKDPCGAESEQERLEERGRLAEGVEGEKGERGDKGQAEGGGEDVARVEDVCEEKEKVSIECRRDGINGPLVLMEAVPPVLAAYFLILSLSSFELRVVCVCEDMLLVFFFGIEQQN